MKKINFVNTPTKEQYTKAKRWLLITSVLIVCVIPVLIYFHVRQFIVLYDLRNKQRALTDQTSNFESATKKKYELHQLLQSIKQERSEIKKLATPDRSWALLNLINLFEGNDATLTKLSIKKGTILLQAECNTNKIDTFLSSLKNAKELKKIQINSLHSLSSEQTRVEVTSNC